MEKTVFITGGSRGLGFAFVETFLCRGWRVYATVRSERDAEKIGRLDASRCIPIIADITSERVQEEIKSQIPGSAKIDLLINNAGAGGSWNDFEKTSLENVKQLFDVHCLGAMQVTQALFSRLSEHALIINISSRFGSITKVASGELDHINCSYSYKIAKSAQNMFTLSLSKEFEGTGRRACSVHPGKLKTASASKDADRLPGEAAEALFSKIETFVNGRFYDLFEGELGW